MLKTLVAKSEVVVEFNIFVNVSTSEIFHSNAADLIVVNNPWISCLQSRSIIYIFIGGKLVSSVFAAEVDFFTFFFWFLSILILKLIIFVVF